MIIKNKNYSKELYLENAEHIYQLEKLKDRIYMQNYHIMTEEEEKAQIKSKLNGTYIEDNQQILDYNTNGNNVLLKDEDEKFLLLQLNLLKTNIFYDLILPNKIFEKFKEDMRLTLDINQIAENRDINMTTNEKEELKKFFYMIYSEEDKNKKRISYELKNKLLLKDLKKIEKTRTKLYKKTIDNSLNYKEYKQIITNQMKVIININPTIYYYKQLVKLLKNKLKNNELEDFVTDKYIKTIEMNIERIRKISDILILMNIRLVINLVKQYMSKVPNNLNFNDIKNEGILGFMQAIYKFNPFLEQKLSTYATWWIRQAIISTINNFRNIVTVPLYYSKIIKLAEEVESKLSLNKQKKVSEEEIIKELNKMGHNITLKKLQTAKQFISSQNSVPLDNSDNEDEDKQSFEDIAGFIENHNNIEKEIETEEIIKILKEIIEEKDILTPKEKLIIKQRLPLFTDEPKTLEEIGKKMNRTKERVRQLETDALNKIKKTLPLYFDDIDIDFNTNITEDEED